MTNSFKLKSIPKLDSVQVPTKSLRISKDAKYGNRGKFVFLWPHFTRGLLIVGVQTALNQS